MVSFHPRKRQHGYYGLKNYVGLRVSVWLNGELRRFYQAENSTRRAEARRAVSRVAPLGGATVILVDLSLFAAKRAQFQEDYEAALNHSPPTSFLVITSQLYIIIRLHGPKL